MGRSLARLRPILRGLGSPVTAPGQPEAHRGRYHTDRQPGAGQVLNGASADELAEYLEEASSR